MGEWSGFFPSSGGDRKYKTAHIAAITDALFHSGVCQSDDLTLAPAGAMTAALSEGRALVNGYHYQNDSPLTLTFGYADGTLARIDAVMLRRDVNSRDIHAVVVPGTPAINPTAPACTRDADAYDLCLYHVRIPAGATAITASMITDRRADADLCGYVYCKFAGIGTSVMQAAVDEMIAAVSSELNQLNAGTAVMTKAQYDPDGSGVDVTAQIYKCTKSGKVYALTGHGGFGRFKVPAAWASGDTWTVNGKSVPAYCGADAVDGDTIVAGRWVLFSYDGTQINFSGGGGLSLGKLAQATALPGQVLAGIPYYAGSKSLKKGTMPDRGQYQYGGVGAGTDYIAINALPEGYAKTRRGVSVPLVVRSGSYMDDLVLMGRRWADIQSAARKITKWVKDTLHLTIKDSWTRVDFLSPAEEHRRRHLKGAAKGCPGLDMAGYVMHRTYTTVRPGIFKRARRQYMRAGADLKRGHFIPLYRSYRLISYNGYFKGTKSRAAAEALNQQKLFKSAKWAVRAAAIKERSLAA